MVQELEIWIAEYSLSQSVFHVDTLSHILAMNHQAVAEGHDPGFIPLYVAVSQEDAHAFVKKWKREHLSSYQPPRQSNHGG